jgi:KDO2-lipid IV(A) lauroyltransferase
MAKAPRTLKQHLIARLEWLPIELGRLLLPRLSRSMLLRLIKVVAFIGMHVDRRSRRLAIENIRFVFPSLSEKRRHAILVGCFRNVTRVLFDMFWFGGHEGAARVMHWAPLAPSWKAVLELPGPKVMVSAHHGNWEMAGQIVAANGFPLMSVGKPLGTDATTRKLNAFRSRLGQELVSSDGAVVPLLRTLRKGKNIALLADQHLWDKDGGLWVEFLGHPAQLAPTPAFLAHRIPGCVITVAYLRARPNGSYVGFLSIISHRLENESIAAVTQRIADASSALIRRFPTQWLFAYRLWRDIPKGQDVSIWPTYALPVPD